MSPNLSCRKRCALSWSGPWGCLVSKNVIRQALRDSVNEVLEKMFFVETLGESPLPEPGTPVRASEIAVRLTFHGEPAGSLTLHLSSAAASPIAADFLGADEESVTGQQTAEVVCELAN